MSRQEFALYSFFSEADMNFSKVQYSHLKYGCDHAARNFGHQLAREYFAVHSAKLLSNQCVVIPSPYNHVHNAASTVTHHLVNMLNHLIASSNGHNVETTVIHRKVNYTMDYGFLQKEQREQLINNDEFYFNEEFIKDKFLIFVDDVKITGAHERRMCRLLDDSKLTNDCMFLYIASYTGIDPTIEAHLNLNAVDTDDDFIKLISAPTRNVVVRSIKWLLSKDIERLRSLLARIIRTDWSYLEEIYFGCLGEGYHTIPVYQPQFAVLKQTYESAFHDQANWN